MGYIASKFIKKEDLPADDLKEEPGEELLSINSEYCIGCGICTKISSQHFGFIGKKATVISQHVSDNQIKAISEAINKCPPKAITFTGV